MFSPTSTVNLEKLWDSIGTAYADLDDTSKATVEAFWTSMFESIGAMYYDLRQNHLAKHFAYTQHYHEEAYQNYDIIFDGDNKNVDDLFYYPPSGLTAINTESADNQLYGYKVSCVAADGGETLTSNPVVLISGASSLVGNPNVLTWSTVSGISSYKVYGRSLNDFQLLSTVSTASYTDDGTDTPDGLEPAANTAIQGYTYQIGDGKYYMTMPTLSGYTSNQVLEEGTDFEIQDLNIIKFLKPISSSDDSFILYNSINEDYQKGEKFLNRTSICLLPTLGSIYFPGFDVTNPNDIVSEGAYSPFLSGWGSMTYFSQRTNYAIHLSRLSYAISNVLRREPTMTNIKHGLSLILGFPFNYEEGVVSDTSEDSEYKYITISSSGLSDINYAVPAVTTPLYSGGDSVDQFAILISGINVDDYINNFALVSGVSLTEGEEVEFDIFTKTLNASKTKFKVLNSFVDDITLIKQSDEYTVTSSQVLIGSTD